MMEKIFTMAKDWLLHEGACPSLLVIERAGELPAIIFPMGGAIPPLALIGVALTKARTISPQEVLAVYLIVETDIEIWKSGAPRPDEPKHALTCVEARAADDGVKEILHVAEILDQGGCIDLAPTERWDDATTQLSLFFQAMNDTFASLKTNFCL